ncbi:hypothetical protein D1007_57695 [Hordeum vulgare]|nr:hypothetical protein D1007_57695 [Hordeum vulgare]
MLSYNVKHSQLGKLGCYNEFFQGAKKTLPTASHIYAMASKIDKVIAAKLYKSLNFNDNDGEDDDNRRSLDMGPTLSLAQHTPQAADTHALHLGMVMQRLVEMRL